MPGWQAGVCAAAGCARGGWCVCEVPMCRGAVCSALRPGVDNSKGMAQYAL